MTPVERMVLMQRVKEYRDLAIHAAEVAAKLQAQLDADLELPCGNPAVGNNGRQLPNRKETKI